MEKRKFFKKDEPRVIKFPEGKTPPNDVKAERNLLGSIFLDNSILAKICEVLEVKDFYNPSHQVIYRAMLELYEKNSPFDITIFRTYLQERELLESIGGDAYLAELLQDVGTTVYVEEYAKIIKEKSLRRRMIESALEVVQNGFTEEIPTKEYLDKSEQLIYKVNEEKKYGDPVELRKIVPSYHEKLFNLYKNKGHVPGIPTGFARLDQILLGLQDSDLVIIAARPGMGKTSFALNIALNVSLNFNKSVVFMSLEMSLEALLLRLMSIEAKIDSNRLKQGYITDVEYQKVTDSVYRLNLIPLFIDESTPLTIFDVRSKARRMRAMGKCDLLIIDYLQLMSSENENIPREQRVSEISRSLKSLAKELKIPVVALSQLNRSPETRLDKHPVLSDLRESGAIEQDADVVLFIYREEYYNSKTEKKNLAEIIVAKHRNGPTGIVELTYIKEFSLFSNLYLE